jgi:Uma2 family endonuclease
MSTIAPPESGLTAAELAARIGDVPLSRVRTDPTPGSAVEADVERILREEDRICELIDGILVEKAVSDETAALEMEIGRRLGNFVVAHRLGWILGPDGFVRLFGTRLRAPDVSFVRRGQRTGSRLLRRGFADAAPALAVEVFSPGNTRGEIEHKREEFFAAGTGLFWVVYPDRKEIVVSPGPHEHRVLGVNGVLDGGNVLQGFSVRVADLFAVVDLSGTDA